MHRIDTPNAVGDGLFADPDPIHGVLPTLMDADWANDVQENIVSVITHAGTGMTKGDPDDLYNAISSMVAGGGGGGAAVASVALSSPDHTLSVGGGGSGAVGLTADLAVIPGLTAGTYTAADVTVDEYGRVTDIADGTGSGSVTTTGAAGLALPAAGAAEGTIGSKSADVWANGKKRVRFTIQLEDHGNGVFAGTEVDFSDIFPAGVSFAHIEDITHMNLAVPAGQGANAARSTPVVTAFSTASISICLQNSASTGTRAAYLITVWGS